MDYIHEKHARKFVIGISIKTSNAQFLQDVSPLWNQFYEKNMVEKIPNRINRNILAVYMDYEGDYTLPFTYLIGCEVSHLDIIPEKMQGIEISSSPYAVFIAKGEFPQSMAHTWGIIWNSDLKRTYTKDFEVYSPGFNPFHPQKNPEIKICIAI